MQTYYKGYGSNTHERQYVLEYEEICAYLSDTRM